jgi:hypothetical protein
MDMNYYIYNTDQTGFTGVAIEYPTQLSYADVRNIPLENAVLLDSQLYDNRELDYWKLLRTKELVNYLESADNNGFVTSLKLKSDCSLESVEKLSLGLKLYELNSEVKDTSKVVFCDYNNELHEITLAQYKAICKEVGNDYSNRYGKKWTVRKAINEANTIEELKAIVI